MPEDMRFDNEKGDAWVSTDGEVEIREGSIVRLRILGVSVDAGQMSAMGTIKDAFLGQLPDE
jgi:DNA-directed RNA polymerase II subunit RPB7